VVTDVNTPNLDGIALIKELRRQPECKFTPILMRTTEAGDGKKQEGKATGARCSRQCAAKLPSIMRAPTRCMDSWNKCRRRAPQADPAAVDAGRRGAALLIQEGLQ
jgi:CheY-like chemotaxis protein